MEFKSSTAENLPVYYVGQHESRRQLPISPHTVSRAFDCNVSSHEKCFILQLTAVAVRHDYNAYNHTHVP